MPRSGTTLIHESFSARSDVAWFSRPLNRIPRFPSVTVLERLGTLHPALQSTIHRSDQIGPGLRRLRRLERVRLGPTEGIPVWEHWFGGRITGDFRLGERADDSVRRGAHELLAKLLRYQGRDRFVAKLTGPGHITFLDSIFEDALFLHVIRDGRAVVNSLMGFPAWRDSFRARAPAWENGITADQLREWRQSGGSPHVLAAIEWRTVIETTRAEAAQLEPGRYTELRYEDFLADPHAKLDEVSAFCRLPRDSEAHRFVDRRDLRDMNYRWREQMGAAEIEGVEARVGDLLAELGYPPAIGSGDTARRR
jgi:hypothetical protein